MYITKVRHDWPEKAGFLMLRPTGIDVYTFLHFSTSVQIRINGKTVNARPGACIFYAPGAPQWFYCPQDLIHNWFHADASFSLMLEQYDIPQNQLMYPKDTSFISDIFRLIETEFFSNKLHKDELIESYLKEFLIKFSRAMKDDAATMIIPRKERKRLQKLRQEILSHPEQRWTVSDIAALAELSPSRFHALYKALFSTSPMHDVIEAKISYAKSLLLSDEQLTLISIAEKAGYNDQYHFIRQFKSITGETPGAYRKARR